MPGVKTLLDRRVTFSVECVDRLYLNGYVPKRKPSGQVVRFLPWTHDGRLRPPCEGLRWRPRHSHPGVRAGPADIPPPLARACTRLSQDLNEMVRLAHLAG